jgi:SAM-dependent methyltransferase
MSKDRASVRELAHAAIDQGDPTGWFERVYAAARGGTLAVPWDDRRPNAMMVRWLDQHRASVVGGRALDVGCGLGDNAEELARRGFAVTAFDVAPTAIAGARERFPRSPVRYEVADLMSPPERYQGAFDLVTETYTLQALPASVRPTAIASLRTLLAPGGTLLVVARARGPADGDGGPPWPLGEDDLAPLADPPLVLVTREQVFDDEAAPVRRWVARYLRPG